MLQATTDSYAYTHTDDPDPGHVRLMADHDVGTAAALFLLVAMWPDGVKRVVRVLDATALRILIDDLDGPTIYDGVAHDLGPPPCPPAA